MSELDRLILLTQKSLENKESKDNFISEIKYPQLFLNSLKELRDLIGNDSIKDSIATQIVHLLSMKNVKRDINSHPVMLNTILYGPPGTGKTLIATKLAKIWYAIGFIHGEQTSTSLSQVNTWLDDPLFALYMYGFFTLISILFAKAKSLYNYIDPAYRLYFFVIIGLLLILIIGIVWFMSTQQQKQLYSSGIVKDSDIITIVSREDFINKYLGGTDKQTKALLEANTGKVLFIDEAYSLYNGEHDMYGMEALTVLNRYLSEHPDRLFVIMAGYKDLIQESIFAVQPGLPSRFMWQFECNGYDSSELCDIFLLMVKKDGWTFSSKDKPRLYHFFNQNQKAFNAFGRDIQRLLFFSQLEYSKTKISGEKVKDLRLTLPMVQQGLMVLLQNNINKDKKPDFDVRSTNPMHELFNLLQNQNITNINQPNKYHDSFVSDKSVPDKIYQNLNKLPPSQVLDEDIEEKITYDLNNIRPR